FADLLQQLVRADNYAGSFPDRLLDGGDRAGGRGRFQEATDLRLGAEELLDALAYFGIIAADLVQVGCPVWGRLLPGRKENGFKINGVFGHERGSRSGAIVLDLYARNSLSAPHAPEDFFFDRGPPFLPPSSQ